MIELTARDNTHPVSVGGVMIGGGNQVVVQSMTDTDTADIPATVAQVKLLADAGSEIVRITVNNAAAAAAVPLKLSSKRNVASPARATASLILV